MNKAIVILSGGLDSTTLLYEVVKKYGSKNVTALTFYYGSKHNHMEIPLAKKNTEKLGVEHIVIDVEPVFAMYNSALLQGGEAIPEGHYADNNMKKTVVPFRNGILLSIAVGLAESRGAKKVYYGAHGGDHNIYPDCRVEFVEAISKSAKLGTFNEVEIVAPYSKDNKITILTKGLKLGVDYSLTWTCYSPSKDGKACGRCGSCTERLEAFEKNNIKDPLEYIIKE